LECEAFLKGMEEAGVRIPLRMYFEEHRASIQWHFRVLRDFDPDLGQCEADARVGPGSPTGDEDAGVADAPTSDEQLRTKTVAVNSSAPMTSVRCLHVDDLSASQEM
jgi:hypothetical protein